MEGGGTKTAWVHAVWSGETLRIVETGRLPGSNYRLTNPERLRTMLRQLPPEVDRLGIFLAGCVTADDRRNLAALASEIWPRAYIVCGSDRDSGLAAALGNGDGIAVNAGTGSSITGRRGARVEGAGGWGHVLGDAGGGYYLSVEALRLVLREYDIHRGETEFAASVLRALCLNSFDELVRWAQTAEKMDLAMLTPVVFAAAEANDANVREIVNRGACVLAEYTTAVATRLGLDLPEVKLLGGLFQCCAIYQEAFGRELARLCPAATVGLADKKPEEAAAWLALGDAKPTQAKFVAMEAGPMASAADASTERANPRSASLDQMTAQQIAELFVSEERSVEEALRARLPELARAIEFVAEALRKGGRLFYVGAGTSGRLGVLDASEIPSTFGTPPELFQGIVAGGVTALYRSAEDVEDQGASGALAISQRGVRAGDVVCGIAASGRTPFVFGALREARNCGAHAMLLTCNPARQRGEPADVEIDLDTGPELLTGSTRLKAGTATKVALNIISTGAMVLLGKVRGNSMIDLHAVNTKLRDRAVRLVVETLRCDYASAMKQLEESNWNLRAVLGPAAALRSS
ncbi:MAG: N-acetylmuramic acid 6-phosphate etherase [Chthoniobacterales bacterium]